MNAPQQPLQGISSAIASGQATGAAPGGPAAQNQWDGSGLGGKGLNEAGVFKEKEFGKGFSLGSVPGALELFNNARGNSMFQKIFDAFEGKDGWFKNTMGGGNASGEGGSSGGGGGGGSNHAYSAVGGAASGMGGVTGGGSVPMSALGNLTPSVGGKGGRGQDGPAMAA